MHLEPPSLAVALCTVLSLPKSSEASLWGQKNRGSLCELLGGLKAIRVFGPCRWVEMEVSDRGWFWCFAGERTSPSSANRSLVFASQVLPWTTLFLTSLWPF